MDESSEVAIAESESLEAPPTTDNYDSVGAPQSGEVDLMAKQRSELGLNQDKGSLTPASGGELREATGLSISRPKPTRRRQRKKGQKQSQNQEQPQILVQSQDITAAQGNIQAHTPSALPSRWGLGGSVLPQFNNPPHPPVQPPNHLVQYPFNPSATNFWPGVHPSSPLPNRYPGPLKNQGQSGPSHSNVSKWAY
ncbi:MAG: hypothetical protein M1830_006681 [Pleopsidium flavum]|nr:MAG: hypothetical protein M1830_006681 [Pleopsidium flavum]